MQFVFPFGVKHIESSSDLSGICSLLPKPVNITAAFSALNVPCFYFKRTWQSVPSQGEQSPAKPPSLPHACFEPKAKVPPRVRHSPVLTVLSKVPESRQAEFFHSFLLALHLHQALTQLLLSPRCLCLPAELRVNLQLLWLLVNICRERGRALLSSLLGVLCQDQLQGLVEDGKLRLLGLQHTVGCGYEIL